MFPLCVSFPHPSFDQVRSSRLLDSAVVPHEALPARKSRRFGKALEKCTLSLSQHLLLYQDLLFESCVCALRCPRLRVIFV